MNLSLFYFLHTILLHNAWLGPIVWFFADPFIYIVFFIVMIRVLVMFNVTGGMGGQALRLHGQGRKISKILLSPVIALFLAKVLKILIHTDRPFVALTNVHPLFVESGYAFPSGHSATIAAFALAVFFHNKNLGYICIVAAVLVGIARVMAGVHFPVDIIGGYALGLLVAFLIKSL